MSKASRLWCRKLLPHRFLYGVAITARAAAQTRTRYAASASAEADLKLSLKRAPSVGADQRWRQPPRRRATFPAIDSHWAPRQISPTTHVSRRRRGNRRALPFPGAQERPRATLILPLDRKKDRVCRLKQRPSSDLRLPRRRQVFTFWPSRADPPATSTARTASFFRKKRSTPTAKAECPRRR